MKDTEQQVAILTNADGWVASNYITDATIVMKISKNEWDRISTVKNNYNWRYKNGVFTEELLLTEKCIRDRRQEECFNIIDNRSQLWYLHLTEAQKTELDSWYNA